MKVNRTSKLSIIAVVCFVLTAGAVTYAWFLITAEGTELATNMQTVRDRELLDRERVALQKTLDDTSEKRELLNQYIIIGDAGIVTLLSTIDELVAGLGLILETKQLEVKENEDSFFDTLVVSFRVEGDSRSAMKFLQLLEFLPYRGEIISFEGQRNLDTSTGVLNSESTVKLHLSIINDE